MRSRLLAIAGAGVLFAHALPASAHGTMAGAVDAHWTFDPWVVSPLLLSAVCYAIGAFRLRQRAGHWGRERAWRSGIYAAAWITLVGALVSPLHWLGEHVFTFHMLEHELVMAVAAPLLVLSVPAAVLLWGLPNSWRRPVAAAFVRPAARALWQWATRPRNATVLHGLAIWVWHVPSLFDAAVGDLTLHRLQHATFLLTALLFWWSMLRRNAPGVAVWHLFVTMVHTSILGAWITLAPRVLYHVQTVDAPAFGLAPLEDQQLAGVIMWVPAETVYAAAALALAALWVRRSRERNDRFACAASARVGT